MVTASSAMIATTYRYALFAEKTPSCLVGNWEVAMLGQPQQRPKEVNAFQWKEENSTKLYTKMMFCLYVCLPELVM